MMKKYFLGFICICILPFYSKTQDLQGKHIESSIYSNILEKDRNYSIYLPRHYNAENSYPVIYALDGQNLKEYIGEIDKLINNNQIREIIIVGVYSDTTDSPKTMSVGGSVMHIPMRTLEYVKPGKKDNTITSFYNKHQQFFQKELIPFIENNYAVSKNKENKLLYGYSNGGAFALTTGLDYPELFGTIIAYSIAGEQQEIFESTAISPAFHLFAGLREYVIYDSTKEIYERLKAKNYVCTWQECDCGHERKVWNELFINQIKEIYSNEKIR